MRLLSGHFPAFSLSFAIAAALAGVACESPAPKPSSTERAAFLGGASGETIVPNFFIEDFRVLDAALLKHGWSVAIAAGSKDGELPGSVRASNANLLQGVIRTLESVKPGGQALLVFHSHGRQREPRWGQRSHSIVSEERDEGGVDIGFDLDTLEPELVKAQARGVRVALLDLSCYSGATQALHGTACTVSLAAQDYVSLCSGRQEERAFNSHFFRLPIKPVSLEAQFLESRRQDAESINLPKISSLPTPGAEGWEDFLKQGDPLDTYEELKNLQGGAAAYDSKFLLGPIDAWIKTQKPSRELLGLRKELTVRLGKVLAMRKDLESQVKPLALDYDDLSVTLKLGKLAPKRVSKGALYEALRAVEEDKIPEGYSVVQRNLIAALRLRQPEVISSHAAVLSEFKIRREKYDREIEKMELAAGDLFEVERKLYDLQPLPQTSNPCRDFTL